MEQTDEKRILQSEYSSPNPYKILRKIPVSFMSLFICLFSLDLVPFLQFILIYL